MYFNTIGDRDDSFPENIARFIHLPKEIKTRMRKHCTLKSEIIPALHKTTCIPIMKSRICQRHTNFKTKNLKRITNHNFDAALRNGH